MEYHCIVQNSLSAVHYSHESNEQNMFLFILTLSVMGYLTMIISWGGVLKTHSLKPDLALSDHHDNHTM